MNIVIKSLEFQNIICLTTKRKQKLKEKKKIFAAEYRTRDLSVSEVECSTDRPMQDLHHTVSTSGIYRLYLEKFVSGELYR